MIPRRVRLKGFLCYKDEQTIDFDPTAKLWMLSGLNGSGKSTIFDAVTYALFGYHRGGSLHAHELINKDSDTLLVEFDFLLDGKEYRAKRTLKRDTKGGARGTQQMFRHDPDKESNNGWAAVEATDQKRPFEAWVKDNVGLEYDTFTSSVLLLQGKAEKLLDSRPEGRREVLAGIVDLGRYERLHQKADEKRKTLEAELKSLTNRLSAVPAVAPLELAEARNRISDAEEARAAARAEVERLVQLEHEAKTYQELRQRLRQAEARLQRAGVVLGDAAAIEKAVERLRELREVYPRLREIAISRGQGAQADDLIVRLNDERLRQVDDVAAKEASLRQAKEKRATIGNQIVRDETTNREVTEKLRESTRQIDKLAECERYEADLERLRAELGRLPADPQTLLALAREEFERLESHGRVLQPLTRFAARRQELGRSTDREKAAGVSLAQVRNNAEARKKEAEDLRPRLEQAKEALEKASEQATEARTLLTQAKQSLQDLTQIDGAKVCRACGQPLTEGHLAEEKKRRAKAVTAAITRADVTDEAMKLARRVEQELRKQVDDADRFVQTSRDEYREHQAQQKQARAEVERLQAECSTLYGDLPDEFRSKVCASPPADWLATNYPVQADLDQLRAKANGLEAARRKKTEAERAVSEHDKLEARKTAALENLTRLLKDLPSGGDRQNLRKEHADLEARARALFKSIDAGRASMQDTDREIDRLTRERDASQKRIAETDGKITDATLTRQNAQRNVAAQTRELPQTWRATAETMGIRELDQLDGERKQLERDGTDERARDLEAARNSLSAFEQDVKDLEAKEAAYAAEAKREPAAIAEALKQARFADHSRDGELSQARKQLALLESYEKQRAELDGHYRTTEKELVDHRLLCELLGRERLQLYLVRQAERQVVEYANAVLDRLSGGQLYLRLSGEAGGDGGTAKALELEAYNRATGERPINVAFLSGSQKFRVAVSLALGIGQYASRQHRPIESVIIDEGFGCLDSQGRQVMIQELQNLRSQMRCILLVSHQEDFADAFSDGYHFQLEGGATKVRRIQK